jgi:hypothetical protein
MFGVLGLCFWAGAKFIEDGCVARRVCVCVCVPLAAVPACLSVSYVPDASLGTSMTALNFRLACVCFLLQKSELPGAAADVFRDRHGCVQLRGERVYGRGPGRR